MKNFGKILSFILIIALALPTFAFAADNTQYADSLYNLGLFKGTDKGYELDKTFTREEAATILVRLLGEEKKAEQSVYDEVFSDVESNRWSFAYVMYCLENKITKGTGNDTFSPENPISAEEFVTLVLRLLGYTDAAPDTALEECVYLNLLNSEVVRKLQAADEFIRDDMINIVYKSLMTQTSEGEILANILAKKSVISEKEAMEFDIYNNTNDIDELLDKLLN